MDKPITTGLDDAFDVIKEIRMNASLTEGWLNCYEYRIGEFFPKKVREVKKTAGVKHGSQRNSDGGSPRTHSRDESESAYHESPGDGEEDEDPRRWSRDISNEERRAAVVIYLQTDTKEGDPETRSIGSGAGKTGSGAKLRAVLQGPENQY